MYEWLETEVLWIQRLDQNAVLVYDDSFTAAAILGTDDNTVNGSQYKEHYRLKYIQRHALFGRPQIDEPGAKPAPGQKESNYVNMLTCGHEVDTEHELPHGNRIMCSIHGWQTVQTGNIQKR
jgi:hypothetical protein